MRTSSSNLSGLLLGAAGVLLIAGCGGTGQVDVGATSNEPLTNTTTGGSTTSPSGTNTTSRYLAVTVNEISVHVAGADGADSKNTATDHTAQQTPQQDSTDAWSTVVDSPQRINLLDVQATEKLIGSSQVPVGKVTEIRLILANDATLVTSTGNVSVTCPSCTETGLKIPTEGTVETSTSSTLHLTLDFDQAHSLTQEANGDWRLDPVIHLTRATQQ